MKCERIPWQSFGHLSLVTNWSNYKIWKLFSHTLTGILSGVPKRISMIESLKLVACFTAVVLSGILLPAFSFCWVTVSKFPRLLSEGSSGWPKQPIGDFLLHVIIFSEEGSTHPQPWGWHQRQNLWKNSLAPCTLAKQGLVVKTHQNKVWTFFAKSRNLLLNICECLQRVASFISLGCAMSTINWG